MSHIFVLKGFHKSRAFLYLTEIKRRFLTVYGAGAQTAVPYAMNTDFGTVLANEMVNRRPFRQPRFHCAFVHEFLILQKYHSESNHDIDLVSRVHGELDELKDIMVKNIDNVALRGERLELLVNKTENLTANVSMTFLSRKR